MVEKTRLHIDDIKPHEGNPRTITDYMLGKLVESVLTFGEMLDYRPIVVNTENIVIGGNQRYKALKRIVEMDESEIEEAMDNQLSFRSLDEKGRQKLIRKWSKWKKKPVIDVYVASEFSDKEELEFMIRDNCHYGENDDKVLKENYDVAAIENYFGEVKQDLFDYTDKINDSGIDIETTSKIMMSCGYLKAVLTQDEYDGLVEIYHEYLDLDQPEIGFINYLLCK